MSRMRHPAQPSNCRRFPSASSHAEVILAIAREVGERRETALVRSARATQPYGSY